MYKLRLGCVVCCLLVLSAVSPARAQDSDPRALLERLDRVERDLNQLQRQVYRNEVGTTPAPSGPDISGAAPATGTGALDVQIRMGQIEAQMRTLTGQQEEIQYNISQLSTRLDKMQSDNEVRFQQIEGGNAPAAPNGAAGTAAANTAPPPNRGAGNMDAPAAPAGPLNASGDAAHPAGAPPAAANLPSGSIQDQYNFAFGLLRQQDYAGAEAAFKAFLQAHPKDPLAANAQYWLGQSYFVRKDYAHAAAAFAEGYQKYPQGPKAPDSLLRLGSSLGDLNKKADACASFARLEHDFPAMSATIKQQETGEKKRLGC